MIEQSRYDKCVEDGRRALLAGATVDEVLTILRAAGCYEIDCIKVLRELTRRSLGDLKQVVHYSPAFADRRESNEALHAAAWEAAERLAAESAAFESEPGQGKK
ncbi:hypothetical protein [Kutzneria sp. NPDC051319]|uniref:hypothetical protein n=1 Tax=Kutzneria sp. NPDC051319 TaxID=3155047 RepID=UPI00341EE7A7